MVLKGLASSVAMLARRVAAGIEMALKFQS
jgi:hypothetical protein